MIDLQEARIFAIDLAQKVGKMILDEQGSVEIRKYKDRQDVVTNIDIRAEKEIIQAIQSKYPSHSIFSEEAGGQSSDSNYRWIIDPIDGTKEYLKKLPDWNTSFALEFNKEPVLSVVYKPISKEMFSAAKGSGSFLNDSSITPSNTTELQDSFIYAYLPTHKVDDIVSDYSWGILKNLSRQAYRIRGLAEEAAGISWVASGKIDACINPSRFPDWYDFVPGLVIAKEAGCVVTDLSGEPIIEQKNHSGYIIANNKKLHQQIINIFA